MIDTFNGALMLKQTLFQGMREAPDAIRRGFFLVLLVGLLVGTVQGISSMITNANPEQIIAEIETALDASIKQQSLGATSEEQRAVIRVLAQNREPILNLIRTVIELPAMAPRPVGVVFKGIGLAVSQPLTYLSTLILAVVCTHMAARQLGGVGNIQQMLGLGSLSVAPHALDALAFIPGIGTTFSMIAWVWGFIILVIATSVAHRLDNGRATLAVMLYPLVGSLVFLLSCCGLLLFSIALGG